MSEINLTRLQNTTGKDAVKLAMRETSLIHNGLSRKEQDELGVITNKRTEQQGSISWSKFKRLGLEGVLRLCSVGVHELRLKGRDSIYFIPK